jgi:hypothetical protein
MTRTLPFSILLLSLAFPMFAQQNIFNVPSSDITLKSKVFFQEQVNFISDGDILLNTTFCYGLGKEWEIGFNVLGLFIEPGPKLLSNGNASDPPLYPYYTVNLQKAWKLSNNFKLAAGTQTGFSTGIHFGTYNYFNMVTALPGIHLKLIAGLNYGSESFLGPGDLNPLLPATYDPIGYQVGIEQEILHDRLIFQAEHISGTHSLGLTAVGLASHITEHWVLSLGYQFSNHNNPSPNSVVFEFTFVPSAISSHRVYHDGHPEID